MSYNEKQLFQRELAILEELNSELSVSEDHKTLLNDQMELFNKAIEEISEIY
ncbi:hypothetical protein H0266_15445 [Halobacillus locisalis]|uniref:Uncharacterized protein n=1 Tax=Halobacillus locisalis TaxID=220753 RepID=A0A838CVW5_9BACI|nr:hypothetical protein [Halobacillus locisalis]MBA2176292.1 hypothetical protein [Halobacillus locisalis]